MEGIEGIEDLLNIYKLGKVTGSSSIYRWIPKLLFFFFTEGEQVIYISTRQDWVCILIGYPPLTRGANVQLAQRHWTGQTSDNPKGCDLDNASFSTETKVLPFDES